MLQGYQQLDNAHWLTVEVPDIPDYQCDGRLVDNYDGLYGSRTTTNRQVG